MKWSILKEIPNFVKCLGSVALGFGTLFLGLAAYYKSSEIYDVIKQIKDLDTVVQEIKVLSNSNNKLLTELARMLKENTPKNKEQLDKVLSAVLPKFSYYVQPEKTEKDEIIKYWSSLPSDDDREKYLLNVFKDKLYDTRKEKENLNSR
ncbi:MAG: hypothetical protein JSS07_03155 [Proteobacteria bacterium]|nr:hypothetical protein [Pseudomonadota bacterium]